MEKFDAKGQIVYIEPTWVTGETCLFNIHDPFMYIKAKSKLSEIRKKFIERLKSEGFVITYEKTNNPDVVYLIMDDSAITDYSTDITKYKKLFDKKIFEAGGEKLNYPYSLTMEQYFEKPFFPAVLKNEMENGGVDKFFIETEEQLEKIKNLYKDYYNNSEYKEIFNNCIFQQYIPTPTNYQTYMRVLMSASGDVLGASLKYSKTEQKSRTPIGKLEKHFWNEKSEYYLDCKGMFNYYSDGGNITFTQPRYSREKEEILLQHNIPLENVSIPSEALEVSTLIAQKCNRELGIICGIDFIYNREDNKWYYLEIQSFPAIEEWAITKDIRIPTIKKLEDSIKYCSYELEARYDALIMYTNKKLATKEKQKVNTIKF